MKFICLQTNLYVASSYQRRLPLEVSRIDDVQFAGVQNELGKVDFAAIDCVQQSRTSGRQTLAVVWMIDLELAGRADTSAKGSQLSARVRHCHGVVTGTIRDEEPHT